MSDCPYLTYKFILTLHHTIELERLSEENMAIKVVPSEVPAEIGRLHLSETRRLIGPPPVGVDGCEWD